MIETVVQVSGLLILAIGTVIIIFKFKRINEYLIRFMHSTSLRPIEGDFRLLLIELRKMDIESKVQILQAVINPRITIQTEIIDNKLTIIGVSNNGLPLEDTKSIG